MVWEILGGATFESKLREAWVGADVCVCVYGAAGDGEGGVSGCLPPPRRCVAGGEGSWGGSQPAELGEIHRVSRAKKLESGLGLARLAIGQVLRLGLGL